MYIVAIAWIFTAALLSLAQHSVVAGVLTFFFWGIFPLALILWLIGTPSRRRRQAARNAVDQAEQASAPRTPD